MEKLILFHGTPDRIVVPTFGKGEEKHDYGQGFYLSESIDLAKEWAVCRPNEERGWVHKYELETDGLRILGIQYCIKTERAYSGLHEVEEDLLEVPYAEFNEKYNQRDLTARQKMRELVDSDANQVTKVFSTLFEE